MVFLRCAWHRRYFGYPTVYGVRSWRGARFIFAEGRCPACAERKRAELRGDVLPPAPLIPPGLPRIALALALVSALVLAARPVNDTDRLADSNSSTLPATAKFSDSARAVSSPSLSPGAPPAVSPPRSPSPSASAPSPAIAPRIVAAPPSPSPALAPATSTAQAPVASVRSPRAVRARATTPGPASATERAVARVVNGVEASRQHPGGTFVVLSPSVATPRLSAGAPVRLGRDCPDRRPAPAPPCWTATPPATLPRHIGPTVQAP